MLVKGPLDTRDAFGNVLIAETDDSFIRTTKYKDAFGKTIATETLGEVRDSLGNLLRAESDGMFTKYKTWL